MKNLLMSAVLLAVACVPAGAEAAACRNAKGQFAKCGAPGAMSDAQYHAMKGKPMMTPMKPSAPMMSAPRPMMAAPRPMMMGPKPAATPAPGMKGAAPTMMKKAPCKDGKGKFVKCK